MSRVGKKSIVAVVVALVGVIGWFVYAVCLRPTRILVVNPLPAQEAEIILNNDSRNIKVTCIKMEDAKDFDQYDAVLMYGRGLYLDSLQLQSLEKAAKKEFRYSQIHYVISALWLTIILTPFRWIGCKATSQIHAGELQEHAPLC